jgi:hypothetical protein
MSMICDSNRADGDYREAQTDMHPLPQCRSAFIVVDVLRGNSANLKDGEKLNERDVKKPAKSVFAISG